MRKALEEIEKIEQYLEGKLTGEDLQLFESKLRTDTAFQHDVQSQEIVVNRVSHIGRTQALNKAHTNFEKKAIMKKWIKTGIIGAGVTVAAIAGASELTDDTNNTVPESNNSIVVAPSGDEEIRESTFVYQDTTKKEGESTSNKKEGEIKEETTSGDKDNARGKKEEVKSTPESDQQKKTDAPTPGTKDEDKKVTKKGAHVSKSQDENYRKKGTKMYIWTNDANAKKHFIRELQKYNIWKVSYTKKKADYQINLYEEKILLDRMVWIEIVDMETDEILYLSPRVKGLDGGIKTVNMKQQAIYNLVHDVLRFEFFMKKEKDEPKGTRI